MNESEAPPQMPPRPTHNGPSKSLGTWGGALFYALLLVAALMATGILYSIAFAFGFVSPSYAFFYAAFAININSRRRFGLHVILKPIVFMLCLFCIAFGLSSCAPASFQSEHYTWVDQFHVAKRGAIRALAAVDRSHVWAAGREGIAVFDGESWQYQIQFPPPFTGYEESSISAVDDKHVWAVSNGGRLLFFNGQKWEYQNVLDNDVTFKAVSAADANHVWATCTKGIAFFDGSRWSMQSEKWTGFEGNSISALDPEHVWAVGHYEILFFDGTRWLVQQTLATESDDDLFYSVFALDAEHVWAGTGYLGRIWFFDGSNWRIQVANTKIAFNCIYGVDASHVWAIGFRTVQPLLGGIRFKTYWHLYRYDGTTWQREYQSQEILHGDNDPRQGEMAAVTALDTGNLWMAGTSIWYGTERETKK